MNCTEDFPGLLLDLMPLGTAASKVPPQKEIPIFITGNNNPTYVWYWARLTECYGIPLRLYDQASDFPPFLALLGEIEKKTGHFSHVKVVRNGRNRGPHFFFQEDMRAQFPPFFAITDPDLVLSEALPPNWLRVMAHLQSHMRLRVGSALDVSCPSDLWHTTYHGGMLVEEWEGQFWRERFLASELPPGMEDLAAISWKAGIDTTLAVYQAGEFDGAPRPFSGVRLGGPFLAAHTPWYTYFPHLLLPGELQAQYLRGSSLGSTVGKMLVSAGLLTQEQLRYVPDDWNASFTRPVWKWVAEKL